MLKITKRNKVGLSLGVATASLMTAIALPSSAGNCPYPTYIDCLQAGETIDFCKAHNLNCNDDDGGGSGGGGGGGDNSGGGGTSDNDCPYPSYIECLQAGQSVDWCKTHVLNCVDDVDLGDSGPDCSYLYDETTECGGDTYIQIGQPLDITLVDDTVTCPYDSYVECLLDGRSVDWCKKHVLNCTPYTPTEESYSLLLPFAAKACVPGTCWPCATAEGTIEFTGTPEIIDGQYCLHVKDYTYDGPFAGQVEPEIEAELNTENPDCNDQTWCVCTPLECIQL